MKKKLIALAGLGAGLATVAELAIHGYLDVMYKETIPQGVFKRTMLKETEQAKIFHEYTAKSCEWIAQQDIETIDMKSSRGDDLKGYYLPAKKDTKNFVVFAHGYRSTHLGDPANFQRFYHESGYNFFAMDHVSAGESSGDYVGFDLYESQDLLAWVDYLIDRFGDDIKIILHGVSMGGATVCKCSSQVPEQVKLIISDCAYTGAKQQFTSVAEGAGIKKAAPVLVDIFNAMNKAFAGYDLEETDVLNDVANAKVPMLFVHGGKDTFVPTKMVYELYDACTSEKELFIVDDAIHAQSIMIDTEGYTAKIAEFISKHL